MASSQQHLAPLTSAIVVCRTRELQALPHVVDLVSNLLDYSTRCSAQRACELNDLRLLKRVAARELPEIYSLLTTLIAFDALVAAVRNDNLEIASDQSHQRGLKVKQAPYPRVVLHTKRQHEFE